MNFSSFFIKRPIFAGVLSIAIFVMGLIAMFRLPIAEYPEVVPPTIVVKATYPGATPKTIAETVASPLEQAVNGVEGSLYMFSQATGDGVMTLTVTFALGTDIDKAQVQVQNRVSQSLPKLPEEVRNLGALVNWAVLNPPNNWSNYYNVPQINALLASATAGAGTNVTWGTSTNSYGTTNARPANIFFINPTNPPPYNTTNYPHAQFYFN